jgi:hypothetical protein
VHFLLTFLLIAMLFAGYDFARRRRATWRVIYVAFATLVLLHGLRLAAIHAGMNFAHPPRYDFLCFWLDGRVALVDHNVYLPTYFHQLGDGLHEPADWVREFLDVGFLYPPISIVWFAPLGFFPSPQSAIVAWDVLLYTTAALAVVALWRQFFSEREAIGLIVAGALVLSFPSTIKIWGNTQTIGMAFLFALLFRGDRNPWRAGVWVALAFSIKPFLITLLLVPLITRAWRTFAGFAATVVVLGLASTAIIGPAAIGTYLHDSPVARLPGYMYSGIWNQSLLGWLLRWDHREPARLIVTHETPYIVLALLIALVTTALCVRLVSTDRDAAIALSLMLGLLIYPQTLTFYALLLVLPLAIIWSRRGESLRWQISTALALAAVSALVDARNGELVYLAIVATFGLTLFIALRALPAPARPVPQSASSNSRKMGI